ncbi:hypothetical protein L2E82_17434 [Cichorium intybus]|uniref:Uncharacterized protein n=1 Tax=Cichorium intybus TaxID=13427 RepID=A0ACB9F7V7_CICIN|nr:hypothetical protein L2E82_17434 [Cichorium intybus]
MEVESSVKLISVSDLLHRLRALTGASLLSPINSVRRPTLSIDTPQPSDPQNPNNHKILKPLSYPTVLVGTLNLTVPSSSCSNSSCLTFSDHSAAVCCDILDIDLRIVGQRIRVVAWNFLALKPHGGYLEIIRWSLDESEENSIPKFNAFYLNSVIPTYEETIIPRHSIYGLLESVSPVSNVPCTTNKTGTRNIKGFLAEITICECQLCCSRDKVMLLHHITREQSNSHKFSKSIVLYFCGSSWIWYPAISRLVGGILFISGMKKKMVFLGEGKSLMMYVTTEKSILHLPISKSKRAINGRNIAIREKGLFSAYTGSITGVYMQGMVIELDQKVLLLLTDHQLLMPHSLRVGATVTVRNFHLEDPKFAWTKVKIFGSCYKTSIRVNIFSPIESGCYQPLESRSLLRKFIESLAFSARLWVLLVVSSLKKKFSGVLSEMEILGSKHIEGLVQKYSSSCLPLSVFRFRHGILTEYCQHESCGCGKLIDYTPPKLVVPISNLISQCEDIFIKRLYTSEKDKDYNMSPKYSNVLCGGKSHDQPIRTILKSEDMNVVLLGSLKISEYSGRLQLVDATGSIDIVIPDLPSVWSIKDIYEINDFSVVIEGFPQQLQHLQSLNNDPFSCKNIFNHFQSSRRKQKQFTIYIYCFMRDTKSRNHILCPKTDKEEKYKELENGSFHLLLLLHKFPLQKKFAGDNGVISNNLSVYAEAVVFPWNLVLKKETDLLELNSIEDYQEKIKLLNCIVTNMQENSSCKKLLLEFKSDGFWKYELLKIGGYYLIKHHEKDLVCTSKDFTFVNSKSHLWNVLFTADDVAGPTCDNLNTINGCQEIFPDIYINLSLDHLSFLQVKLKELKQDLIQPIKSMKEISFNSSLMVSGVNLPKGDLLSVKGLVVGVHNSSHQIFHHRIFHGVTNGVCIHVLIDHNVVKVYSNLSEHSYPVGFGPGVEATFYRVLLTSEGDVLKLTPASFIEVNSTIINELKDTSIMETTSSLANNPATLISEMIHFSDHKHIRLHCKVMAIYVLVMENNNELLPRVKFPLAGFVIDDGSSTCCCWTDNERVVMLLLGLHEEGQGQPWKRCRKSLFKSNKMEMSRMRKILDQHGSVVIKNSGSLSEYSCIDVKLSGSSGSVKESDEQFLKSLLLQACSINTWNVVGSVLDSEGVNELYERLRKLDMVMLPMRNLWVSQVSYLDTMNEARSILQQLLKS